MKSIPHILYRVASRFDRLAGFVMLAGIIAGVPAVAIAAEDAKIVETVLERERPEYDARGMRIRSFELYPKIGMGLLADSNIFATDTVEVDDLIVLIEPEAILKSNWSRHDLELGFDMVAARYSDVDTEDFDDWRIWADGRYDIGRGAISALARHSDLHEWRSSPDNRRGINPTLYTLDELDLGYGQPFGQFIGNANLLMRRLEYDDTTTFFGTLSNADRDRNRGDLTLRIGHQTLPTLQPFFQLSVTDVVYDHRFDRNGFERSSDGYDLVAGTDLDLSGRTFGELYFGYIEREYDDPRFAAVDGPIFGGQITWNITGLTTLGLSADRRINGTTIVNASGVVATGFGFEADHELLRNLILSLDLLIVNEEFQDIERDDDIFRAGLEGVFLLNRYLRIRFGYQYRKRDTSPENSGGFNYRVNQLFVSAEAQL